jgi:pantothenate kinase
LAENVDAVAKQFSQRILNGNEAVCRCAILNSPKMSKGAASLHLEVLQKLWDNHIVNHLQIICPTDIFFEEKRSDLLAMST